MWKKGWDSSLQKKLFSEPYSHENTTNRPTYCKRESEKVERQEPKDWYIILVIKIDEKDKNEHGEEFEEECWGNWRGRKMKKEEQDN